MFMCVTHLPLAARHGDVDEAPRVRQALLGAARGLLLLLLWLNLCCSVEEGIRQPMLLLSSRPFLSNEHPVETVGPRKRRKILLCYSSGQPWILFLSLPFNNSLVFPLVSFLLVFLTSFRPCKNLHVLPSGRKVFFLLRCSDKGAPGMRSSHLKILPNRRKGPFLEIIEK